MPKVNCYQCHTDFEPTLDQLQAWIESGRPFDPTDWQCPTCADASNRHPLSLGEALSLLPAGNTICCTRSLGPTLVLDTWLRSEIINAIEKYGAELTGPNAQVSGFGMATNIKDGWVFIHTKGSASGVLDTGRVPDPCDSALFGFRPV